MAAIRFRSDSEPVLTQIVLLRGDAVAAERCLVALAAAETPEVPSETVVVVVDPDAALRHLAARLEGTRRLHAEVDLGSAASWNLALTVARTRWAAIVHEDTEVTPGWQSGLLTCASTNPRAGVIGARLANPDGSLQNCGWVMWLDGWCAQVTTQTAPEAAAGKGPLDVDLVSSACLLLDRTIWERIGGLDERFFPAVGADVDLGLATWAIGRTVLCERDVTVRHAGAAMVRPAHARLDTHLRRFLIERNHREIERKWRDWLVECSARPAAADELQAAVRDRLAHRAAQAAEPPAASSAPVPRPLRILTGDVSVPADDAVPDAVQERALRLRVEIMNEFAEFLVMERDEAVAAAEQARQLALGASASQPSAPAPLPAADALDRAIRWIEEGPENPWNAPSRFRLAGLLYRKLVRRLLRPYEIRQREFEQAVVEALSSCARNIAELDADRRGR